MRRLVAGVLVLVGAFLSGCGVLSPSSSQEPKQPPAEQVVLEDQGPPKFMSAVELRNAAVGAGYVCQDWVLDNAVMGAGESGRCRDYDAFAVFDGEPHVKAAIEWFKGQPGDLFLLTGSNWLIKTNRSEIEMMQGRGLEGDVFSRKDERPAEPVKGALELAAEACESTEHLGDGGKSYSIETGGEESEGTGTLEQLVCVLVRVDVPDHVIAHIDSTRALDGMQTATWGHFSARWTYHPNDGLNFSLIEN